MKLETLSWGHGELKALLVHGLTSNAEGWWRFGPELAEARYSVWAPDLRGHGASPPGHDYSIPSYAADVLELGEGWDLVVGHSLGGAVALYAQSVAPGFARKLVLEDPAIEASLEDALEWLLEPYTRPLTFEEVAKGRETWSAEDIERKVRALQSCRPEVIRATVEDNEGTLISQLHGLEIPTLLLAADPVRDALVSKDLVETAAERNSFIEAMVVTGSGHSIHRERYDEFKRLVLEFAGRD